MFEERSAWSIGHVDRMLRSGAKSHCGRERVSPLSLSRSNSPASTCYKVFACGGARPGTNHLATIQQVRQNASSKFARSNLCVRLLLQYLLQSCSRHRGGGGGTCEEPGTLTHCVCLLLQYLLQTCSRGGRAVGAATRPGSAAVLQQQPQPRQPPPLRGVGQR